eukprot:275095_1
MSFSHVGQRKRNIDPENETFDPCKPQIKESIIRMIVDYLQNEGFGASVTTIQDESNCRLVEKSKEMSKLNQLKTVILDGEWQEVKKMLSTLKVDKHLLYACYKQQYLELIDRNESQMALNLLTRRLKPLEPDAPPAEFQDLCYLLVCKRVQDAVSFREWDGVVSSRQRLVKQFSSILKPDVSYSSGASSVPSNRLVKLLQQSVAYQMEFSRYHPNSRQGIDTLLEDYQSFVLPNSLKSTFHGHSRNVKCIEFIGEQGLQIASGSSDTTVRLWNTETGTCQSVIGEHSSRVWDISSDRTGSLLASSSGDDVKLWRLQGGNFQFAQKFEPESGGDIYSVQIHPSGRHLVCAGFGKTIHLYDLETGKCLETLSGHKASISSTIFNPHGNLIVSGSKDCTVKFWDVLSGSCVNSFSSPLGEFSSVAMSACGTRVLTATKDNSNRLWDMRKSLPIQRYFGHQNTSKNFIRACFGPNEAVVIGGSEDGCVYLWDLETGTILEKLKGHSDIVYSGKWHRQQSLLASCSGDGTLKVWWYDCDRAENVGET